MILGARLLLLVVILDCFFYYGMLSVNSPIAANFGGQIGQYVGVNGTLNNTGIAGAVNYSQGGTVVQASSLGYTSIGINNIFGLLGSIFAVMTAPMMFMTWIGAPIFVQVLVGGIYIVMVLASIAQLITGRFA